MQAAIDAGTGTGRIADGARRILDWWTEELAALVPSRWLARPETGAACDLKIMVRPEGGFSIADASGQVERRSGSAADPGAAISAFVKESGPFRGPVWLDAPRSLCLVRTVTIPRRALRSASLLLALDLEEATPLRPEDVLSDWFVELEDAETGTLRLRHVVLGRDRIAGIVAALGAEGLSIGRLTVGRAEDRPMPVDLAASREPGLWPFLKSLPTAAKLMLAAAVAVLCLLPGLAIDRAERGLEAIGEARQQAAAGLARLPRANPAALKMLAALGDRPRTADILDEIGARLPASVALKRLSIGPAGVDLSVSGDAAPVAGAFAASPLLGPAIAGDRRIALAVTAAPRP